MLPRLSVRDGWAVFMARPRSLVGALITSVVISVASFFLLLPPAIAGYYFAVAGGLESEADLFREDPGRASGLVFAGVRRYFFPSYVVATFGLLIPLVLLVGPVLPWTVSGEEWRGLAPLSIALAIPAFLVAGSVVLYGYPRLLVTRSAREAVRYTIRAAIGRPFASLVMGFLLLFPITAFVVHVLMVITYPFIVATAVCSMVAAIQTDRSWSELARA